ncbi:MAG: hypothetical protein Q7S45_02415 [Candidatus Curtissbacteria bacterium]|nr:hypothetical protein [Candidatus Curtissbacteria bacterium]
MQSLNFQSYLVLGDAQKRREATKILLSKSKINIDKVSPDISIVTAPKKDVTINQVREIRRSIFQKPVSLPYKIVIIEEAENLNIPAQNALLKILEEPPSSAVIILEAKDKSQLLPTILSRVVTITTERKRKAQGPTLLDEWFDQNDRENSQGRTLLMLEEISNVANPQEWLDNQMLALYNSLQKSAKSSSRLSSEVLTKEGHSGLPARLNFSDVGSRISVQHIKTALEQCALAKQMIEANVNPRFVLANLILSLN